MEFLLEVVGVGIFVGLLGEEVLVNELTNHLLEHFQHQFEPLIFRFPANVQADEKHLLEQMEEQVLQNQEEEEEDCPLELQIQEAVEAILQGLRILEEGEVSSPSHVEGEQILQEELECLDSLVHREEEKTLRLIEERNRSPNFDRSGNPDLEFDPNSSDSS